MSSRKGPPSISTNTVFLNGFAKRTWVLQDSQHAATPFEKRTTNQATEALQNVTTLPTALESSLETCNTTTDGIMSLPFICSHVQASVSTAQGLVIGLVCGVALLLGLHAYAPALLKGTLFPAVSSKPVTEVSPPDHDASLWTPSCRMHGLLTTLLNLLHLVLCAYMRKLQRLGTGDDELSSWLMKEP